MRGNTRQLLLWAILAFIASLTLLLRPAPQSEPTPVTPPADSVPRFRLDSGPCDIREPQCAKNRVWRA